MRNSAVGLLEQSSQDLELYGRYGSTGAGAGGEFAPRAAGVVSPLRKVEEVSSLPWHTLEYREAVTMLEDPKNKLGPLKVTPQPSPHSPAGRRPVQRTRAVAVRTPGRRGGPRQLAGHHQACLHEGGGGGGVASQCRGRAGAGGGRAVWGQSEVQTCISAWSSPPLLGSTALPS